MSSALWHIRRLIPVTVWLALGLVYDGEQAQLFALLCGVNAGLDMATWLRQYVARAKEKQP